MFDISNPANPVEVGKYETWRDPDGDGTFNKTITGVYNGAWNVHVFLPSGNVLLSDMKSGTFIFRVDPDCDARRDQRADLRRRATGRSASRGAPQPAPLATRVRRSTTSGGPYTTITNNVVGTSFTDTGLANGTPYFYVVSATNAEGAGGSSSEASATPMAPSVADLHGSEFVARILRPSGNQSLSRQRSPPAPACRRAQ